MKKLLSIIVLLLALSLIFSGCDSPKSWDGTRSPSGGDREEPIETETTDLSVGGYASVEGIPDYSGKPYVELNGNQPEFTEDEIKSKSYEFYSELDSLGRCGVTHACVGKDIMPTTARESISSVKPSGWINRKYDSSLVDGGYIYNRCHLIGFQLTGENANKNNLITGTRYMNVEGMLPFENMVADYVKETGNHVMYRVTPIFVGNNLLASGVKLEAYSVEDQGDGICFNVFVYNVQPGITINYFNGDNWLNGDAVETTEAQSEPESESTELGPNYVLNKNTKKIHRPTCSSVEDMHENNREDFYGTKTELLNQGYMVCGICKP